MQARTGRIIYSPLRASLKIKHISARRKGHACKQKQGQGSWHEPEATTHGSAEPAQD